MGSHSLKWCNLQSPILHNYVRDWLHDLKKVVPKVQSGSGLNQSFLRLKLKILKKKQDQIIKPRM